MISKYFFGASFLIVTVLLLASCLNSGNNVNTELSPDAQIHAFSMSSSSDSLNALTTTKFAIDQLQKKIYNESPLPYQFSVDSVKLNIAPKGTYASFSNIVINLKDPDSSFVWENDSIPFHRLKQITTTAPDRKTQRTYDFEVNIHQQDPYVLTWEALQKNYLITPVNDQKTVVHNNRFFTYYLSNGAVKAASGTNGTTWTAQNIIGLPPTVQFSSFVAVNNAVYALDADNMLYKSTDGLSWAAVQTPYPVVTIYGELPSATAGTVLAAVNDNDTIKFAETNDFSTITLMNKVPENIPVKGFSATKVNNPDTYAAKYIILSGGTTSTNQLNNAIWLLQEKDGIITSHSETMPASIQLQGNSVFAYDRNKVYLLTVQAGKNVLMISENYGLNWKLAGANQTLPADFTFRTKASVITDSENYIWIFGGISANSTQIVDTWRGRLNRLANN